ncbi:hypothetical protein L5515_013244 [Caenorhabditis briggsae]|uniref:NOT2/NOT3/NOT5 C-terminal domain-containing protein n=2 Tax=Caenorhabditis briggsae TaxID=6238 RepID=A0AAE9E8L2_CAEBR|nr:hypothetical protein L5515_013244 [Caenorhabditis briggsae]
MNSVGGVATERRLPSQQTQHQQFHHHHQPPFYQQHQHSNFLSNATIIDESQFPSLGAKGTSSLGGGFSPIPTTSGGVLNVAQSSPSRQDYRTNYANLMRSDPTLTNSEFQIQNEDFPALPGVGGAGQSQRPMLGDQLANMLPDDHRVDFAGPLGDCDPSRLGGIPRGSQEGPLHGIVTHPDGEVTNIPASMLDDQFGMAGLVTYLRTVDNPSIVSLALGYDLTTLGLSLNTQDRKLHRSFGGPWADSPIRAHELDVKVPDEYLTHNHIRDKLPPLRLNKVSEDVLFYLFYNCPNEIYQVAAACELYHREWRFHKSEQVWLTRSQYGGVREQTGTYEKGHYNVFDQMQWRKIPKELKLEYKELEEKPKLPQAVAGNGQQQQPPHFKYYFQGPQFPSGPETGLMLQMHNLGLSSQGQIPSPTPAMNGVMGGVPGGNGGAPGPGPMQMQQGPPGGAAARATPN